MLSGDILSRLASISGPSNVLTSPEDKIAYSYDGTPLIQQLPEAVIRPRSPEEICGIVRLANEAGFPLVARGSGTGLSGGSVPVENSVVVLTSHWNRILEIDEQNLSAWVEPGVITAQFHSAVEARGLFYPPDPGSAAVCTIGGNVAENAGGLRGLKYGVTKDYVLGLEAVLPNGELVRTGGKVVKDVAGYNLKDWLVGSEGTLAIFTKILLRLVPRPETARTMLVFFDRLTDAAETVSAIIAARITPAALEFLDNTTIRCVEDYAKLGLPVNLEAVLMIEVDGRSMVVDEDVERILTICKKHRARSVSVARDQEEAQRLKSARKVAFAALARIRPTTILEDATVPRSLVAPMLEFIQQVARKRNLTFGNFGHAGDGNLHPTCLTDERDAQEIRQAEAAFEEIYEKAIALGGTITGEHGTGLTKKKFLEKQVGSPALELMRRIKSVVDPHAILNPGKIFSPRPRCEGPMPRTQKGIQRLLDEGAFV